MVGWELRLLSKSELLFIKKFVALEMMDNPRIGSVQPSPPHSSFSIKYTLLIINLKYINYDNI